VTVVAPVSAPARALLARPTYSSKMRRLPEVRLTRGHGADGRAEHKDTVARVRSSRAGSAPPLQPSDDRRSDAEPAEDESELNIPSYQRRQSTVCVPGAYSILVPAKRAGQRLLRVRDFAPTGPAQDLLKRRPPTGAWADFTVTSCYGCQLPFGWTRKKVRCSPGPLALTRCAPRAAPLQDVRPGILSPMHRI
jgi:hypothetical protein